LISAQVFSTSSAVRLNAATLAPSAASRNAAALPMPEPAPVTNAIFPFSSMGGLSLPFCRHANSSARQLVPEGGGSSQLS